MDACLVAQPDCSLLLLVHVNVDAEQTASRLIEAKVAYALGASSAIGCSCCIIAVFLLLMAVAIGVGRRSLLRQNGMSALLTTRPLLLLLHKHKSRAHG